MCKSTVSSWIWRCEIYRWIKILLTYSSSDQKRRRLLLGPRIFLSFVPFILYLLGLSYVPLPVALSASDSATSALAQLIVLGTIILGLLSGFGAVSSAWRFLPFVTRNWNVPNDQDVDTSQYALSSIRNDLRDRRLELERRSGNAAEGSWLSRVGSSFRGGDSCVYQFNYLLKTQVTQPFSITRTSGSRSPRIPNGT